MSTLMLERPASGSALLVGRQRQAALVKLVRQLEVWLPAAERRLTSLCQEDRSVAALEVEWQAMLGLYERLCTALA